ncbi:MAG TPA: hypothetical protein PLK30_10995 [Blastocatellia bacterium]|nr:hypothetical protein [Blastocatellia bacterium]
MSKRTLLAACLAMLVIANVTLVAQQPARKAVEPNIAASNTANTSKVLEATNQLLEEVSKMRELKILSPVKSGAKSRAEIEQEIIRGFEEESTPEEIEATNKALIAYGLVPRNFKYREFMIQLMTEQVAGFYRPKTKELFLADWNDLEQQKPVMAHELQHALQDQHFNLMRFEKWPNGDGDRETAIHALIEGDATALMYNYQLKPMGGDITKLPSIAGFADQSLAQAERDKQKVFLSAPMALRESLMFSYIYGAAFVQEMLKKRGWAGVSQAFTDLPQSTEQILHFEKYATGEMPIKVQLPDISKQLGGSWKKLDADVNGEFGYSVILAEFINKKEARQAAAGWGGDQSVLYENAKTGQLVLTHLSKWDTEKDAAEFFRAYLQRTAKRYPMAKARTNNSENERAFQTPDGEVLIQLHGQSVLVVEGLPPEQLAALPKLAEALMPQTK